MSYIRDRAIILKSEPFREHDAWVTLYGLEQGKMTAVARGARRMGAKAMGFVEPLAEVEVMIAKGAAFDKLAVLHQLHPRLRLRERLTFLAAAGMFADLVVRLTHPGIGDARVFNILRDLLEAGDGAVAAISAERARLLVAGAGIKLLDVLGYRPQLDRCLHRACALSDAVVAVGSLGGVICPSCARLLARQDAFPISIEIVRLMRFLRDHPLSHIFQLTGLPSQFMSASLAIESFYQQTPLTQEPHASVLADYLH